MPGMQRIICETIDAKRKLRIGATQQSPAANCTASTLNIQKMLQNGSD